MVRVAGQHVAIVTGGAGFIGSAVCRAAAREGASVACVDNDETKREATVARLRDSGATAASIACDIRDAGQIEAMLDAVERELGPADWLVNVPGIAPVTPFLEMPAEEWRAVMELDIDAIFVSCQAFCRRAVAKGMPARVVNITSGASRTVRPGLAHYSAAKGAVEALSKGMAVELAPHGIHVHAVNPGLTKNDYNARVERENPAEHRTKMARIPLGRMADPEEVAEWVVFLLGPEAGYMTGNVVDSDGGYQLGIPRYE
jgi:NAD(P)-dependent dehydrogenase (short-subunit alcohol dehydrogenase family)